MIKVRRGSERGHFDHGWLDTYHTFSFGAYRDGRFMGFGSLRVINEDRVAPGQGFGMHPHRDMEIITYILAGSLEHRDSMGHGEVIGAGDVQYMAAGTGVEHSEFNASARDAVHLMQVWITPDRRGATPRYERRRFPSLEQSGRLSLLVSGDGADGSIRINQDARVLAARLGAGDEVRHALAGGRGAWVQVLRGAIDLDGEALEAGDGAAVTDAAGVALRARGAAEVMVFDVAGPGAGQ